MASRAEEQQHHAHGQDPDSGPMQGGGLHHAQHVQGQQDAAQQDDPQGAFLEESVREVAGPLFLHEGDDHARVQVDDAQHHGPIEHCGAVVHRTEEIGQALPGGAEHARDNGRRVAEAAAGESAHDKGADAAVEQQLAEGQGTAPGLDLLHGHQRRRDHDEAVAHVRHHQPVKQDEEGGHDGVGVHRAVSRQAVHVGDHVQGIGEFVVFQLDGYVRVLVLRGIPGLPGAFKALQQLCKLLLLLGGDPALQHHGGVRAVEAILRLGHGDLGRHPVEGQLQLVPMGRLGRDLAGEGLLLRGQLLQGLLRGGDALPGGAAAAAERRGAEAEAPQAFLGGRQLFLCGQEQHIALALVLAHGEELRLLGGLSQSRFHFAEGDAVAEGAQHQGAALGALGLQREIQALPGPQALDQTALPALLGADAADAILPLADGGGQLQRLLQPLGLQEGFALLHGLGAEQRRLCRRVALQQLQCPIQGRLSALQRGELAALPVDKALVFLLLQFLLDLRHLHAAQLCQLPQELLLLRTNQHQPQPFHFQNGHVSRSLSFPL